MTEPIDYRAEVQTKPRKYPIGGDPREFCICGHHKMNHAFYIDLPHSCNQTGCPCVDYQMETQPDPEDNPGDYPWCAFPCPTCGSAANNLCVNGASCMERVLLMKQQPMTHVENIIAAMKAEERQVRFVEIAAYMKSWHVELMNGKTITVTADNIYSACVKAADLLKVSTEDIASINVKALALVEDW